MRPKKSILLYCADRELLSSTAFALRLQPYDVTAVEDMGSRIEFLTLNTSEYPSDAVASSLSDVLETGEVPQRSDSHVERRPVYGAHA